MAEWLLEEHEIDEALKPYWVQTNACEKCGKVNQGMYLLSPSERDRVVAKAQLRKIEIEIEKRGICVLPKQLCWGLSERDLETMRKAGMFASAKREVKDGNI